MIFFILLICFVCCMLSKEYVIWNYFFVRFILRKIKLLIKIKYNKNREIKLYYIFLIFNI